MGNVSAIQHNLNTRPLYEAKHTLETQNQIPTEVYVFESAYQHYLNAKKGTDLVRFEMNNTGQGGTITELRMIDIDADEVLLFKEACPENIAALNIE